MRRERCVVVGAGAFGTALANVIAGNGVLDTILLGRDPSLMADLKATGRHEEALPGVTLSDALEFSADPGVLSEAKLVLFVMPSQAHADAATAYGPHMNRNAVVITCAKGIDRATTGLLSTLLGEKLPGHPIGVLSGPGFAADIARGLPTAMSIAASDLALADELARAISGPTFRLYASDDPIGVQLGGALKNVLAIACGMVEGAGLGDSARAALISRGLAEMSRLAVAMGGKAETMRGLSGLGDLVLTATSHQSRNLRYGISLGQGLPGDAGGSKLVEGAFAAAVASRLAEGLQLDMPITQAVAAIIDGVLDIPTALDQLMRRPITTE